MKTAISEQDKARCLPWALASVGFNAVFVRWTFGGSLFVLFLAEVGLPSGQIGVALSLFPLAGLLALGFAPVAARWGRKRVFLACYGMRKLAMALLLLLPLAIAHFGRPFGLKLLFAAIVAFAILRALAETAYYPWLQEFVPNRVRGKFAARSALVDLLCAMVALWVAGHVLDKGTGLTRFLILIGTGCVFGLASVPLFAPVPGGAPLSGRDAVSRRSDLAMALRDRNFVNYLAGMGCVTVGSLALMCFLPLYVKTQLGQTASTVVRLDAAFMLGGALSVLGWGALADRVGSRPVLMSALAVSLLVPVGWLLLPRHAACVVAAGAVLYFVQGMAANGVVIGSGRLLFNSVIPRARNTPYTALYYAAMGLSGGLAPLLAGWMLTALGDWEFRAGPVTLDSFGLLFVLVLASLAAGWACYERVRPDDVHTTRAVLARAASAIWS